MATDGASARPLRYSPQLDGLRAVSVVAVAYSHWLPAWQFGLPLGAGVHLFFVLSGFLITRILLALRDLPRRGQAVGRFYVRRALRLFPAFYLVLGLAWLADVPLVRETWAWHAAYLSNVRIASDARWMGHVSHFWSLAVEEQFYLLWPWLIVWSPRTWLGPILAMAVLSGPASRYIAATVGLAEPFWALVPAGSADSLGVGALVAWAGWRRGYWWRRQALIKIHLSGIQRHARPDARHDGQLPQAKRQHYGEQRILPDATAQPEQEREDGQSNQSQQQIQAVCA